MATFALSDDASGLFEVVSNELKLKERASLDHESQDSYEVTLEVTDGDGASYTETVTIDVADVKEYTVIDGTSGNDIISGTDADEKIIASSADDVITGGGGNDRLIGDDSTDVFVYNIGDGSDFVDGGVLEAGLIQFKLKVVLQPLTSLEWIGQLN